MNTQKIQDNYSAWQVFALTFLRVLIGWHFLYEGLVKLLTPGWTAKGYLMGSVGPLAPMFNGIAQNETILAVADLMNEWGLVLIGLSLLIGLLSKPAKIAGIALLAFYYLAYPPFAGLGVNAHVEGSYWVVNKNLIEMAALLVLLLFSSSHITGIDRLIFNKKLIMKKQSLFLVLFMLIISHVAFPSVHYVSPTGSGQALARQWRLCADINTPRYALHGEQQCHASNIISWTAGDGGARSTRASVK